MAKPHSRDLWIALLDDQRGRGGFSCGEESVDRCFIPTVIAVDPSSMGQRKSVLFSQCLDRRIRGKQKLTEEVTAWEANRNKNNAKANWQFTIADARVKLNCLYPTL